ncbi:recombinase family protein [Lamprocystis purpurea]|uniref:recombinase family protein n=1 Tax=Lamprocystis purpurea TaxID=61598 RepID=UPI000A01BBA6|nr:recombinase family protein [Lamprocystis purpurea]
MGEGDTLTVWKLDLLGRSPRDLIGLLDELKVRGVAFRSLTEAIDTTTPTGPGHVADGRDTGGTGMLLDSGTDEGGPLGGGRRMGSR